MNRYLVILFAIVLVGALLVTACGTKTETVTQTTTVTAARPTTTALPTQAGTTTTSQAPTTTTASTSTAPVVAKKIKLSYTMPKGASIGAGFEWFATEFPKRTQGRYAVETYPSNTLVPVNGALDAVKAGTAEIVGTSTGTFPKNFPLTLVVSIPTLGFPGGVISSYVEGSDALWELHNAVPEIKAEHKDFKLLWTYMLDPYNLASKSKEIHAAADFRGLKVGGSGAKMEMVTAAGGAKVQMVPPQSYENLDKGLVDAAFVTMAQVADYKLFEICNNFYLGDFGGGNYIIMMNQAFYDGMSPADQKLLMDTWREANVVSGQSSMANVQKGIKEATDAKKKVIKPTADELAAWETAADTAIQSWKNDSKALGISEDLCNTVLAKWKEIRAKHMANVK